MEKRFVVSIILLLAVLSVDGLKVWGPGLNPGQQILPAQYFFLRFDGNDSITPKNLEPGALQVTIQGTHTTCRIRTEILSNNDKLAIVRYKIYYECPGLVINILHNGKPLQKAIHVEGPIYPDYCDCPKESLEDWQTTNECSTSSNKLSQMDLDLARFQEGVNFMPELRRAEASFNNPGAFAWCHYVIKDQEIYRKCYGEHVGFSMFWDAILTWILRRMKLPDLQFMANLGDWPLVNKRTDGIPMFSWCGSKETQDIIFPTYELTEASLEMLGRQSLDVLAAMGKNAPRWEDKESKLFWKGRDSRRERLHLVQLSQQNPELINASITNFFFFRKEMDRYGGGSPSVPFFQFFDYKYQLNIDGTVAAYRFPYLLAGNSLVFKQDSGYYEHFYGDLKSWVHYVPVNADLSNLVKQIEWAKENEDKVLQIIRNAQSYVLENLLPHQIFCYHVQLLDRWAKLLKDEIQVLEGMTHVEKRKSDPRSFPRCSCESDKSGSEHRKSGAQKKSDKEEL